eukprot:CFRG4704T1
MTKSFSDLRSDVSSDAPGRAHDHNSALVMSYLHKGKNQPVQSDTTPHKLQCSNTHNYVIYTHTAGRRSLKDDGSALSGGEYVDISLPVAKTPESLHNRKESTSDKKNPSAGYRNISAPHVYADKYRRMGREIYTSGLSLVSKPVAASMDNLTLSNTRSRLSVPTGLGRQQSAQSMSGSSEFEIYHRRSSSSFGERTGCRTADSASMSLSSTTRRTLDTSPLESASAGLDQQFQHSQRTQSHNHEQYDDTKDRMTALLDEMRWLEERKVTNEKDLLSACANGRAEKVKDLLQYMYVNPNCSTRFGMTPLHYAAMKGHLSIVRMLLLAGANPEATNNRGESVLELARKGAGGGAIGREGGISVVDFLTSFLKPDYESDDGVEENDHVLVIHGDTATCGTNGCVNVCMCENPAAVRGVGDGNLNKNSLRKSFLTTTTAEAVAHAHATRSTLSQTSRNPTTVPPRAQKPVARSVSCPQLQRSVDNIAAKKENEDEDMSSEDEKWVKVEGVSSAGKAIGASAANGKAMIGKIRVPSMERTLSVQDTTLSSDQDPDYTITNSNEKISFVGLVCTSDLGMTEDIKFSHTVKTPLKVAHTAPAKLKRVNTFTQSKRASQPPVKVRSPVAAPTYSPISPLTLSGQGGRSSMRQCELRVRPGGVRGPVGGRYMAYSVDLSATGLGGVDVGMDRHLVDEGSVMGVSAGNLNADTTSNGNRASVPSNGTMTVSVERRFTDFRKLYDVLVEQCQSWDTLSRLRAAMPKK